MNAIRRMRRVGASFALAFTCATPVHATENGGSIYPLGGEIMDAAGRPPPGLYGMLLGQHYDATRLNDASGNDLNVPGFRVRVNAVAPRLIWVTPVEMLGGQFAWHAIVPLVNLRVSANGVTQTKTGIGDITTGPGLLYQLTEHIGMVAGIDFFLPTGGYNKYDLANIGRHYVAAEPVWVLTWRDPAGPNADIKFGYLFNGRNNATDYKSGHEFHFDYALGWGLNNGWTAGFGGYVYDQTTDDDIGGVTVPNNRGSALAIGPAFKYDSGKQWFVTAKWQFESKVKNRAQGNAFVFKAVFPL